MSQSFSQLPLILKEVPNENAALMALTFLYFVSKDIVCDGISDPICATIPGASGLITFSLVLNNTMNMDILFFG